MTYQAKTETVFFLNQKDFRTVVKKGMERVSYEERMRLEELIRMKMWAFSDIKFPCSIPKKTKYFEIIPLQDQINVEGHIRFLPFQKKKIFFCREAYVIFLEKPTTPLSFFDRRSYHSVTEMKLEIQNKLATYLPLDFDWFGHLGMIEYIEMH